MKFIIVITMMFLNQPINPSDKPVVEVNTLNGVPLEFNTMDICYKHVRANLYHLKRFAIAQYSEDKKAMVNQIWCIPVERKSV
jgi:hypothetical protein